MIEEKFSGSKSIYLALYFLGAILSGSGGSYLWLRNVAPDVVVADRFTGTQALVLEDRINNAESKIAQHQRVHPDLINKFDARIIRLETQIEIILRNQTRILDKLDRI